MDPKSFQSSKSNTLINFCQMSCRIDPALEETLCDIDEFIQSELGFASPIVTEPAAELHELSSPLQTRESSNGPPLSNTLGEHRFRKCIARGTGHLVQNAGYSELKLLTQPCLLLSVKQLLFSHSLGRKLS